MIRGDRDLTNAIRDPGGTAEQARALSERVADAICGLSRTIPLHSCWYVIGIYD